MYARRRAAREVKKQPEPKGIRLSIYTVTFFPSRTRLNHGRRPKRRRLTPRPPIRQVRYICDMTYLADGRILYPIPYLLSVLI